MFEVGEVLCEVFLVTEEFEEGVLKPFGVLDDLFNLKLVFRLELADLVRVEVIGLVTDILLVLEPVLE